MIGLNTIQQQDVEKEQELYTYKPKLNDNYYLNTETAEKVILNSNSYLNYVERVRKGVSERSIGKYSTLPGSGNTWKNQLTSPKRHPLYTDKKESNGNLNVRSLKKVKSHFNVLAY